MESVGLQFQAPVSPVGGEDLRATCKDKHLMSSFILPSALRGCVQHQHKIRMSYADRTVFLKPWPVGLE